MRPCLFFIKSLRVNPPEVCLAVPCQTCAREPTAGMRVMVDRTNVMMEGKLCREEGSGREDSLRRENKTREAAAATSTHHFKSSWEVAHFHLACLASVQTHPREAARLNRTNQNECCRHGTLSAIVEPRACCEMCARQQCCWCRPGAPCPLCRVDTRIRSGVHATTHSAACDARWLSCLGSSTIATFTALVCPSFPEKNGGCKAWYCGQRRDEWGGGSGGGLLAAADMHRPKKI